MERFSGTFYRRFTLPEDAAGEKIQAKSKDGVLEVTIPKKERHVPKKIEVQVESK
jgi:HSP20 family protein